MYVTHMMTYMASKPKILQGTGVGGGWGLGPQTMEQSWQLHGPVTSSTDSLQPLVAFLMGSIPRIGRSTRRNHAALGPHENTPKVLYLIIFKPMERTQECSVIHLETKGCGVIIHDALLLCLLGFFFGGGMEWGGHLQGFTWAKLAYNICSCYV